MRLRFLHKCACSTCSSVFGKLRWEPGLRQSRQRLNPNWDWFHNDLTVSTGPGLPCTTGATAAAHTAACGGAGKGGGRGRRQGAGDLALSDSALWRHLRASGVGEHALHHLLAACPAMLGWDVEGRVQPALEFLMEELGMEVGQLEKAVQYQPYILNARVEDTLRPATQFFVCHGVRDVAAMVATWPALLVSDPNTLAIHRDTMMDALQLSAEEWVEWVEAYPRVAGANVSAVTTFLTARLGLPQEELKAKMHKSPQFLSRSPQKLETILQLLVELGVEEARLPRLVASALPVLGLSGDKLRGRVAALRAAGLSDQAVSQMLNTHLGLLAYDIEANVSSWKTVGFRVEDFEHTIVEKGSCTFLQCNLSKPKHATKWLFVQQELGWGPSQLRDHAHALAYSLHNRLGPRASFLKIMDPGALTAGTWYISSDFAFCKQFSRPGREYMDFKAAWQEEQKSEWLAVEEALKQEDRG